MGFKRAATGGAVQLAVEQPRLARATGTTTLRAVLRTVLGRGPVPRAASPASSPPKTTRPKIKHNARRWAGQQDGDEQRNAAVRVRPSCHPVDLTRATTPRQGGRPDASSGRTKSPLDTARQGWRQVDGMARRPPAKRREEPAWDRSTPTRFSPPRQPRGAQRARVADSNKAGDHKTSAAPAVAPC